jgi:hypothetical protein
LASVAHIRASRARLRPGESSLTGTFADQAQLHGLLDRLRDLGIQLISVNPVADGGFPQSTRRPAP